MSQRQIDKCTKRLLQRSGTEAREFRRLLEAANELAFEAAMNRQRAWDIYHDYFAPRPRKAKVAEKSAHPSLTMADNLDLI